MKDKKDGLIIAYLSGYCSREDKERLDAWMDESPGNRKYFNELKMIWENSAADFSRIKVNIGASWENIREGISGNAGDVREIRPFYSRAALRIAASVLVLLSLGYISFRVISSNRSARSDIVLAKTGSGVREVKLPDGSTAWLNDDSRIMYPEEFGARSREVSLSGEAFFEVEKNRRKPFVVETGHSRTEVLGTSFNINERLEANEVVLTVVSGRVAFSGTGSRPGMLVLEAGEQAKLSASNGSLVKAEKFNPNSLAWKTGILVFENDSLARVCRILSGHYKRPVIPELPGLEGSKKLTASFDNRELEEVLKIIALTLDLSVRYEDNRVILTRGSH